MIASNILDIVDYIKETLGGHKDVVSCVDNCITVFLEPNLLRRFVLFLKDDPRLLFKTLISICGVDYPHREKRFEIVVNLLSYVNNLRILLKIQVAEQEAIPSLSDVYKSAGWYEREVWDMFGVIFSDHNDLRRILSDYGFAGHPLRKDFPLSGYVQVKYDQDQGKVVYEPVQLDQEYRDFDFNSPWEGMYNIDSVPK